MTPDDWRPFGHNDEAEPLYDALHDGVPRWMRQAHFAWQKEILTYLFSDDDFRSRLHGMEQDLRCEISTPRAPQPLAPCCPLSSTSKS